ncbi:Translocation protein SEC63 homolog [Seminavis robusta]|uniref:Translocation protein SEC63 homolog n=1 Tax=Seminavis robusta TaxID=568900 RepID=A0A9N8E3Q5_9STRA|nr:Translocation protein SEC63 homolog [Seminavis robusta]|eukprot:Sro627_g177900.1 Translocation protein SEC63 homolog (691) ;mRNA; f:35770-37943
MSEADEIPVHLMPVAALLGMVALTCAARAGYIIYVNLTYEPLSRKPAPAIALDSNPFMLLCGVLVACLAGYGKIVATINEAYAKSEHALFDPFDLLGLTEADASDKAVVTSAYREMAKIHHPDKGGSQEMFMKIQYAYEALTDELGMQNFQKYGHPDGPVSVPSFQLALPSWLIFPEGNVAVIMLVLYLAMFAGIAYIVVSQLNKKEPEVKATMDTNTVSLDDLGYLGKVLSPTSSHFEVLLAIASTPENIVWAQDNLDKIEVMRKEAIEEKKNVKPESKKKESMTFDELDEGGWDDDDEEEDESAKQAAMLAKKAEEEKARHMEQLKKATGQAKEPLEGIDEGVVGHAWVQATLFEKGHWPPKNLYFLKDQKFDYKGKKVSALDQPGLQRNLQMTMGRINSRMLNTHPELLAAGEKKLLDQTYFKNNLEYRSRAGVLLEATLRLAICLNSYSLTKTIVEAVAQFKIGCTGDNVEWFEGVIKREYGCLPRLEIKEKKIETPGESEIATGDLCCMEVDLERTHAEKFTTRKIEMFKKQGIPPQVAFQSFREGWWFLVRAQRIDGEGKPNEIDKESPLVAKLDSEDLQKFEDVNADDSLFQAWPMLVRNIAQKSGRVKLQFKAPSVAGKYKFVVTVMSQEFLGADDEFSLEAQVVDIETLDREVKTKGEQIGMVMNPNQAKEEGEAKAEPVD